MRRILSALSEVREAQLAKAGASVERIAEARQTFQHIDTRLSSRAGENSELTEVMTTADFNFALIEFVQRVMFAGYSQKRFNFEPLVKLDTVPNFLPVTRYQRRSGLDDLEYVGEKGIAREGHVGDATKKQYRVYKWEKVYDFSMEALVNDDMGYFNDTAIEMGRTARRTLERFVSRFYTNAVTIARLVGLGAMYSTTGRLTTSRISEARMAFNQRTDASGNPIAARVGYIVHHAGLVDTVRTIINSTLVPENATNAANVIAGTFVPIEDPYITGTAPNLPWYAFSDWKLDGIIPFVLARRESMPGPVLMRQRSDIETVTSLLGPGQSAAPLWGDFTTGNIRIKVYDEWGTYIDLTEGNLFDFRGAYYSAGTAA